MKMYKQPPDKVKENKNAYLAIADCLLFFSGELHKYPSLVEALFQADAYHTQLKLVARASILLNDLGRLNEFFVDQWEEVIRQSDSMISSQHKHFKKCFANITTLGIRCEVNIT